MSVQESDEIPLMSIEEAIAEVRRWLDVDKVDPETVFTATEDQVICYKDLIGHLERKTPDGRLLRFAISRGRLMRPERAESPRSLLQIGPSPPAAETE